MIKKILFLFIIMSSLGVLGCATSSQIKQVETLIPISPKAGKAKPIMFKRLIVAIPRGQEIGTVHTGIMCIPQGKLHWRGGSLAVSDEEFGDILREELVKNDYQVVGDPTALFEDDSGWQAEYLIAGRITDMCANICFPNAGFGNFNDAKGEGYIEVEWQIYDRKVRDVVLKFKTAGNSEIKKPQPMGDEEVFYQAFANAVNNMMANENFYNLIVLDKPLQKNLSEETKIYINYKKTDDFSKKFFKKKKVIEEMRKSVVTIFAGDGHGSGFLISEDGHILTNEHVVGGAHSVQVKFASGREVTGKVIRVNKLRDVALIKLERDIYPFLPISSSTKLDIGTEAYAIGTPLKENLSQTVTRGVISGFREEKGIRYIQSDVNIQPGNSGGPLVTINDGVCGICVSGISFGPISIGLNYFIPIEEAITSLNIVKE